MKRAFTLAEVLITLGVIGVVAALTMPILIAKHKEAVTVNKVKKFYSTMGQALLLSIKDNETIDMWSIPDTSYNKQTAEAFMSYLKPYLLILKDCGTNSGCLGYKKPILLMTGETHNVNYETDSNYYKFILNDGSYAWLRTGEVGLCKDNRDGGALLNVCAVLWYDVNGSALPNTLGRDIFLFYYQKDRLAVPNMVSSWTCEPSSKGWGCSAYIIQNGNMNYLH